MKTTTPEQATAAGFFALTTPYGNDEHWMMENVIKDMELGDIKYVLVLVEGGTEVWRH